MKYDLLIFDLDGTLIDSIEDLTDSLNFALERCSLRTFPVEDTKRMIGKGIIKFLEQALNEEVSPDLFDKIHEYFLEHYTDNLSNKTKCYPGIYEMLERIDGSRNLAIFTNKTTCFVKPILTHLKLDKYFNIYLGGDNPDGKKPSASGVYKLINHFDSKPDNTLIIGDMPVDIETAKASGIKSCAVLWGYGWETDLKENNPEYMINAPNELFNII